MRCHPSPYHHGVALIKAAAPQLHHVNFMVSEVDDIGRAIARFAKNGVRVVYGPGRHPPSGSVFLYFLEPDGLTLEYSFGMEEFPELEARRPRLFEPIRDSYDYWASFRDLERYAAVGAIERAARPRAEARRQGTGPGLAPSLLRRLLLGRRRLGARACSTGDAARRIAQDARHSRRGSPNIPRRGRTRRRRAASPAADRSRPATSP